MNKVFLGLILTVCVLGMALVMLNDRLGRKAEPRPTPQASQTINDAEMAINARAMELAEAAKALAPPEEVRSVQEGADVPRAPMPEPQRPPKAEVAPVKEPEPRSPAPVRQETPPAKAEVVAPQAAPAKPEPRKPEPQVQQATPGEPRVGKTADRFVIYAREKGATVRMGGKGKMTYSSMTLENPDRIVVDLDGDWKFPPNPGIPKNDLVSAVRVGQNGDKTRLVIDLKMKPRKVVLVPFKGGDGVDVRVDR